MAASREPFNLQPHTPTPAAKQQQHQSPWHSPVPYLFGGLAAMLGLIAFALLILACSYWKLSGYLDGGDATDQDADLESGDDTQKPSPVYEEKILVIMAGEIKPTYLATPMSSTSRSSSFGDPKINSDSTGEKDEKSVTVKQSSANLEGQSIIENRVIPESSEQTTH